VVEVLHGGIDVLVVAENLAVVVGNSVLGIYTVHVMVLGLVGMVAIGVLVHVGRCFVALSLILVVSLLSLSQMAPDIEHSSCTLLLMPRQNLACWGAWIGAFGG